MRGFSFSRPEERRKLNFNASVTDRMLEAVAVAIEASPALAQSLDAQPADLREAVSYTQTFVPIVQELRLLADALDYTIAAKRAKAGAQALHAYSLSKTMNMAKDSLILVPHIAAMKAGLGNRGRRKAAAPKTAAPSTGTAKVPFVAAHDPTCKV
jgi:hypothetical protein